MQSDTAMSLTARKKKFPMIGDLASRESLSLIAVLVVALGLRSWNLGQNGWGAEYYAAAVRSMLHSWHNTWFVAFDPAGFISVDKPPIALWVQVLAAKIFGFSQMSLLVPQALLGVLSVWLTFVLVRNAAGSLPGILAALIVAANPLMVAINRTNNMDTCLFLSLLVASIFFLRAAETGNRKFLAAASVALGISINVKMLAALIVVPAFVVVYGLMTPISWYRRCIDLGIAAIITLAVALPWFVAVELTPPDQRPYVGGTKGNSMFELVVGHNAANRFTSPMTKTAPMPPKPSGGNANNGGAPAFSEVPEGSSGTKFVLSTRQGIRAMLHTIFQREFVRTPPGPLRLLGGKIAAQFAWFLPFAMAGIVLGFRKKNRLEVNATPSKANFRRALWFFVLWAATCWTLYSSLGGIIHYYYVAPLIAPLSALSGMGMALLWQQANNCGRGALLLTGALLISGMWQALVHVNGLADTSPGILSFSIGWQNVPLIVMSAGGLIIILGLLAISWRGTTLGKARSTSRVAAIALTTLFVVPVCWTLSSVLVPGSGLLPSADLYRLVAAQSAPAVNASFRLWKAADTASLAKFLIANRGESRYLLATTTTMIAAPLIIETDEAVLVRGGYHGLDQPLNPDRMALLVKGRDLRFVMVGDVSMAAQRMGGLAADKPIADWVRQHGTRVDPGLWRMSSASGNIELFDLRPDLGLAKPSW